MSRPLLVALAVLALGALDGSAYDVATGKNHTCAVAAGGHHSRAVDDNGVRCWGTANESRPGPPGSLVPSGVSDRPYG